MTAVLQIPSYGLPITGVVGGTMMLEQSYPIDQQWLPFMVGTVIRNLHIDDTYVKTYAPKGENRRVRPAEMRRLANRKIHLTVRYKHMYEYNESNVDQCVLPFVEYKRLSPGEVKLATKHWDRDPHGEHYHLMIPDSGIEAQPKALKVARWMRGSIEGRYYTVADTVFFEFHRDWMFAKLRWHGAED